MTVTQVDRLTFTILVDNCIEWMSELPPGFSHELRTQLQSGPPIDEETQVPILDLPNYCCGAHGLCVLITTEVGTNPPRTLLFDTGPDGRALERNLAAIKVPLDAIERVVLSHWHSDHTGGVLTLLSLLPDPAKVTVDAHASRPSARGILPPGATKVLARLPADPTLEEMQGKGANVETFEGDEGGHSVLGGTAWVSGEIPRVFSYEDGLKGSVRWDAEEKDWSSDELIKDERYLLVDVRGKGLVIFSACSHAGICNVVADAQKCFPGRPVHMVVGGLHLAGPELQYRVEPTVRFLTDDAKPDYVVPLHCTGFRAKVALEASFGHTCVPAGAGIRAIVQAS
ncbi:hypothetical protein AURDEDRAFT_108975 [Auricularia subglabra TFB-10046 SS5]|uniref:Metallo-beta-lactamase domain-containing protein n=1 Tax=Auricularia subglabra (strain TFB-10046 / SS5) TaxID=717982 RepID=J0WT84_AURST|nr:hypothetical protein AURDEDRAFT_108975 [Auricularia subglabra TFB-10046 SS5]